MTEDTPAAPTPDGAAATPDEAPAPGPAAGPPAWAWPLGLALVGVLTQARARSPALWAGDGDGAKYAALARSWPDPVLFDGHPYLIHPGGYPGAVAALTAVTGLPTPQAASLLGGLCWTALALLTYALGRRALDLPPPAAALAGLLLLVSRAGEVLGQGPWREPLTTLGLYAGLGLLWWPQPTSAAWRRLTLVAAAGLGLYLGRTWDLFALVAPLWIVGGWRLHRPALLAAGVALAIGWGGWAVSRHQALTNPGRYPAGIDGTWEETGAPPALAWLNPNFLPRTARHNAYFWPHEPTPLRAVRPLAPWFASAPSPFLTARAPSAALSLWAALLACGVGVGVARCLRDPPAARGALLLAATCAAGLGAPALIGQQARYGAALWPALALLLAQGLRGVLSRRAGASGVAALAVLASVAWLAGSQAWTWTRPQRFEGRSVVYGVATVSSADDAVGTVVGLSPDLAWQLPGRRVVTLPAATDVDLAAFLAERDVGVIVVPHEVHPWDRGVDPGWRDEASGLTTLARLQALVAARELTHVGVVVEADLCERPRVRAYDLLRRGPRASSSGILIEPDDVPALIAAHEAGALSPASTQLLREFCTWSPSEAVLEPYARLREALGR